MPCNESFGTIHLIVVFVLTNAYICNIIIKNNFHLQQVLPLGHYCNAPVICIPAPLGPGIAGTQRRHSGAKVPGFYL